MKTILQALKDEIPYPINEGYIENRLMARDMESDCPVSKEVLTSDSYKGAVADCLYALITVPNISESDLSITLPERDLILKQANALFDEIGEEPKKLMEPKVYIGG